MSQSIVTGFAAAAAAMGALGIASIKMAGDMQATASCNTFAPVPEKSPVATAVAPLEKAAVTMRKRWIAARIRMVRRALEACGGDLHEVVQAHEAIIGYSLPRESRREFARFAVDVTRPQASRPVTYGRRDPLYVEICPDCVRRVLAKGEAEARAQYQAYVAKLDAKVGHCDTAELSGNAVWTFSVLTVHKGDTVERWQTRMILNVSRRGLPFNQWPTRKLRA